MDMKFIVRGQQLSAHIPPTLISDTIGYLGAEFKFSKDWDGLDKWAHLQDESGIVYDVRLVGDRADKLNLTAGYWELWLHGHTVKNGEPVVRITTETVSFQVAQSGALEGEVLPVIELSAAEQIAATAAQAVEIAKKADQSAKTYANAAVRAAQRANASADVSKRNAENASKSASDASAAYADVMRTKHNIDEAVIQFREDAKTALADVDEKVEEAVAQVSTQTDELISQKIEAATGAIESKVEAVFDKEIGEATEAIDAKVAAADNSAKAADSSAKEASTFAGSAAAVANRLIPIAEVLEYAQPPDYVVEEAKRVADSVNALQNANTFTFAVASDFHFGLSGTSDGVKHLGQALNIIRKYVPLEMFISLGDSVAGGSASTLVGSREEYNELNAMLGEGTRGIPNIRLNGNHDTNPYNYDGIFTADQIHTYVGKWNLGCVKDHANLNRNYGYLDFEGQKVRCIYLNTSDVGECGVDAKGKACDHRISPEQYRWVIDALNLSDKSDAADWRILIFGHFPFTWYGGTFTNTDGETFRVGGTYMTTILNNYVAGTAGSFTSEETIEFDFSGKNAAKIVAYFHGHTHCFSTGKFGDYDIPRIAIPNACFGRNNEYGQGGNLDYGESVTYNKTADSAEDTAFNIVTIGSNAITCINYGAGRDRTIFYESTGGAEELEPVSYAITNNLTNVTNSNGASSISGMGTNNPYSATLTAYDGYEINSVIILVDGVDVTDSVYDGNGKIYIAGSMIKSTVSITATAIESSGGDSGEPDDPGETNSYTNQIPISIDATGAVYNGCGYKEGYRISTSSGKESAASGITVTGFIPVTKGCVIRLKDIDISDVNSTYAWYGSDFSYRTGNYCNAISGTTTDENGVIILPFGNSADDAYIRISGKFGENPIITVNEEITDNADSGGSGGSGDATTYTNQIPISVDSSGAVYNECGYKEGYRISTSSGGESAASGMTVTGFIPVTEKVVIRLKDIDVSSGNSTYGWYDSAFNFRSGNYCNAVSGATTDDNGVVTFSFNNGSADAYIRISGAFGDNPVITVNEGIT